jgi:hypothetical protein
MDFTLIHFTNIQLILQVAGAVSVPHPHASSKALPSSPWFPREIISLEGGTARVRECWRDMAKVREDVLWSVALHDAEAGGESSADRFLMRPASWLIAQVRCISRGCFGVVGAAVAVHLLHNYTFK